MSASIISFLPVALITGRPPSEAGVHSTSSTSTPLTRPSSVPTKRVEARHQRRSQPSSWLELVFSTCCHCGHGVAGLCPTGGFGIISICITDTAPCLLLVPMQSLPVSPPPITSTRLPLALMWLSPSKVCPASTLFCCESISSAKCMPFSSRPGMSRSRACGVPVHRHHASKPSGRSWVSIGVFTRNLTPSASMMPMRRSMTALLSLKLGMPKRNSPPTYSSFSNTVTS
ncbi:unknown [Prevotella sp. CAG:487]|nr:unknown [Prevotella sp. CAG:487]